MTIISATTHVKYDAVLHITEAELRALAFLSSFSADDVARNLCSTSKEFGLSGNHRVGLITFLDRIRRPAQMQVEALAAARTAFDEHLRRCSSVPKEVTP